MERILKTKGGEKMTVEVKEVKVDFNAECPSCGASVEFNPEKGLLKCPYCDYEIEIAKPEEEALQTAQELDFYSAEERGNYDWGADKKTIICEECAAETIYDVLQVADTCPYCGSHQVMEASTTETLAPNGVCTFQLTDKQAGVNFHKWIKGKIFTPSAAKKSAKPDAFTGVYLPYWTFDTHTISHYTANYGKNRVVRDSEGNTRTEVDWYSTSGVYQEFFDDELVSATTRYDRKMMQKIEPFDLLDNKGYKPEYVTGFLAERYSVGLDDGFEFAKTSIHGKIDSAIESKIRWECGADIVSGLTFSTSHDRITYKYLMLPIWLSSFKYKNKIYRFMVNGQTGKVGGSAPISPLRVTIASILVMIIIFIIYFVAENY